MSRHLLKTPSAIWCGVRVHDATSRLPLRSTHATEVSCLRCLQLAVVEFEREWMAAKYYTADGVAKDAEESLT